MTHSHLLHIFSSVTHTPPALSLHSLVPFKSFLHPEVVRPHPSNFVHPAGSWMFSEVHQSVRSEGRRERCLSLPISTRPEGQPWQEETEASVSLCALLLSPRLHYCPLSVRTSVPAPLPGKDSWLRGSSGFSGCPSNRETCPKLVHSEIEFFWSFIPPWKNRVCPLLLSGDVPASIKTFTRKVYLC